MFDLVIGGITPCNVFNMVIYELYVGITTITLIIWCSMFGYDMFMYESRALLLEMSTKHCKAVAHSKSGNGTRHLMASPKAMITMTIVITCNY